MRSLLGSGRVRGGMELSSLLLLWWSQTMPSRMLVHCGHQPSVLLLEDPSRWSSRILPIAVTSNHLGHG